MIKTGGEIVYPADVEAVLNEHPLVAEVVVYGVPDEYWGERVEAAVVDPPCWRKRERAFWRPNAVRGDRGRTT